MLIIVLGKRSFFSKKQQKDYFTLQTAYPVDSDDSGKGFNVKVAFVSKQIYDLAEINTGYMATLDFDGNLVNLSPPCADVKITVYE